jgi:hypothetical protein
MEQAFAVLSNFFPEPMAFDRHRDGQPFSIERNNLMSERKKKSTEQSPVQPDADESAEGKIGDDKGISPEALELFKKLKGDPVTVRDTILAAFRKHLFDGFNTLVTACVLVEDVTLCKRLLAVVIEMGQYGMFRMSVLMELMTIVTDSPSPEVQDAATQALTKLQRGIGGLNFLCGPPITKTSLKRIRSLIEEATTGGQEKNDGSDHPSAPATPPGSARNGGKETVTGDKRGRRPALTHPVEQVI